MTGTQRARSAHPAAPQFPGSLDQVRVAQPFEQIAVDQVVPKRKAPPEDAAQVSSLLHSLPGDDPAMGFRSDGSEIIVLAVERPKQAQRRGLGEARRVYGLLQSVSR